MKLFARILAILMAAVMLLGVCSCAVSNENDTGVADTSVNGTDAASEEDTKPTLDLPDSYFDEKEICFLTRDNAEWTTVDIFAEKGNEDNVSDAVYRRNEIVRAKYGVVITEYQVSDTITAVNKENASPTDAFYAVVSMTSTACSMIANSSLHDLNREECEYLDFTNPWWDGVIAEEMSIEDHVYFGTGDLLISDNDGTFAIMFNKTIAQEIGLNDIYSLVDNKQWTMDRMYEYEQLAVRDNDGDGKLSYDTDVCGYAYTGDDKYCFMYAGDLKAVVKDEDGGLIYDLDVERAANIADKGKLVFSAENTVDMNATGISVVTTGQKCFGENHCLFFGECLQCVERVRGYDVNFGIVPFPLYDEHQKDYCALMNWVGGVVSIPKCVSADMLEMISITLESMAYYSVDTLTEQYYETNLKVKNAKDAESGPMVDLILSHRIYDLAYYFSWSGVSAKLAESVMPTSKTNVSSANASLKKSTEREINRLIKNINKPQK